VPPENYHLTVAFIGGVNHDRVDTVSDTVGAAAAGAAPFEVSLDHVGAFPNDRRARIAWVGSGEPVPAFAALCGVVRDTLTALGVTFDRHAEAHVTLARAEGRAALPAVAAPRIPPVYVDAVTLYRSFTEQSGARYDPLTRFPLGTSQHG
jgi:2'-5' RNA ligase